MGYFAIVCAIYAVHTNSKMLALCGLALGFMALIKDVFGS